MASIYINSLVKIRILPVHHLSGTKILKRAKLWDAFPSSSCVKLWLLSSVALGSLRWQWLKVNLPSERLNQSWSEHVPRLKKIFSRNAFLFLLIFWLRKSHVIWPFFLVEFWDLSQYFLSFFPLTVKPQPSHWFWNQTRRWKLKIFCWNSVCRTIPI